MYYTATKDNGGNEIYGTPCNTQPQRDNGGNEIYGTPCNTQPQRTMEAMRYTEHHVLNSHKGQWRE